MPPPGSPKIKYCQAGEANVYKNTRQMAYHIGSIWDNPVIYRTGGDSSPTVLVNVLCDEKYYIRYLALLIAKRIRELKT